jgi:hypothetical protein
MSRFVAASFMFLALAVAHVSTHAHADFETDQRRYNSNETPRTLLLPRSSQPIASP